MSSPSKIAKILVRAVNKSGELEDKKVSVESFWENGSCVIIFFRRFGCHFCRMTAKEVSDKIKPILDENNVRLIGIGFDSRFVKPFVEGDYFKGGYNDEKLFLDTDKECYNVLQYKRFSLMEVLASLVSKKWLDATLKSRSMGVGGNLKGDGFQSGGALIFDKNGNTLFEYRQEDAADLCTAEQILKALNLENK